MRFGQQFGHVFSPSGGIAYDEKNKAITISSSVLESEIVNRKEPSKFVNITSAVQST